MRCASISYDSLVVSVRASDSPTEANIVRCEQLKPQDRTECTQPEVRSTPIRPQYLVVTRLSITWLHLLNIGIYLSHFQWWISLEVDLYYEDRTFLPEVRLDLQDCTMSTRKTASIIWRILSMVYNTHNDWVSGHCPSSGIPNTRNHNVSETGSVSVFRWGEEDTYSDGSLRKIWLQSVEVLDWSNGWG
jgi:hypothetical protein